MVFDGTDKPAVLETTVTGLVLDQDYTFYVTALNPLEGAASDPAQFRLAGFPSAPDAISEVPMSRTGTSIALSWAAPSDDGGSAILVYTLVLVQQNMDDEVVYYGASLTAVLENLTSG